jgi:hypothetical protein
MKMRTLLRLALLMTALIASGTVTQVAQAVPPGECAAWDKECSEECWYWHTTCPYSPPFYYTPDDCQRIYNDCMSYCCIAWY